MRMRVAVIRIMLMMMVRTIRDNRPVCHSKGVV